MAFFGKRKREASSNTPDREEITEAASHFLAMRRLWLNGQLDLAIRGRIEESPVFMVMSDVHKNWSRIAALAWDGYQRAGRGFVSLDNGGSHRLNYHMLEAATGDSPLPDETVQYCARYDSATELVFAIYGFPREGDPAACATLWIHPPDGWDTPSVAWKQFFK